MDKIDVWKLASDIDDENVPQTRKEIEEFIQSINGQSFSPGEIVEKVIGPVIGISSAANKKFTIELIERVLMEIEKEK